MKTKQMLLIAGGLSAMVVMTPLVKAAKTPLIATEVGGSVHIVQKMPCGGDLDVTRRVTKGRIEIIPAEALDVRAAKVYELSHLTMFFEPFTVERTCADVVGRAEFSEIGIRLANTILFQATDGRFTIPKDKFTIFEAVLENGQAQTRYRRPLQDVTGVINPDRGTVEINVAFSAPLHFRGGCPGGGLPCAVDTLLDGTQTALIGGVNVFPDTDGDGDKNPLDNCPLTPNPEQNPVATPVVIPPANITLNSCTARNIGRARATDVCYGRPVSITNNAATPFHAGANLVTWTGNDGFDPPATADQKVTVVPIACTAAATKAPGKSFQVSTNSCGPLTNPPAIQLGSFTLGNGEVIMIQEGGRPGVRLLGTVGSDRIRHFQVGKGEAIVTATDGAGNVASAACGKSSLPVPF